MKKQLVLTAMICTASLVLLAGCSNNKSTKSTSTTKSSKTSKKIITEGFDAYNKENLRELTLTKSDGSKDTTYTWDESLSACLETANTTDSDGNVASTSRILTQEDGTNYVYYQKDLLLADGGINENAGHIRGIDKKNDYKFCENLMLLSLSDTVTIGEATDDDIDGVTCKKITIKDPSNGDMTYWFNQDTKLPVQMESGDEITSYRVGASYCMAFEIPSDFTEE